MKKMAYCRCWRRGADDLQCRFGTRGRRHLDRRSWNRLPGTGLRGSAAGLCGAAAAGVLPWRALLRSRPLPRSETRSRVLPGPRPRPRLIIARAKSKGHSSEWPFFCRGNVRCPVTTCQAAGACTGFATTEAGCCATGLALSSAQRGDSWTRSIQRRGALDARHQPLCGRMSKLRFTIKTHTIYALEQLTAFLFCFVQISERRLTRHRPAFFGRGSANSASPYLHPITLLVFLCHRASHTKISNHS